jgi:predicted Zn-dependent protease
MSSRLDELLDKYDENPLDPDIIYSIVKEYLKSNMDDEAEDFLKDLIKKDPKYVQAYITYGNIKENNNEVEDAEYYYRTGLRIAKQLNDTKAMRALEDYLDELE